MKNKVELRNRTKRIMRKTRKGGFGRPSNPFVGSPWNANGPPISPYSPKPWYVSNNSNYYGLSKNGVDVGGYPVYYGNIYKNIFGGGRRDKKSRKKVGLRKFRKSRKWRKSGKQRKSRKVKGLGLNKRGGSLVGFIPQPLLNFNRGIGTDLINYIPGGRVWQGVPKKASPYPTSQPQLKDNISDLI